MFHLTRYKYIFFAISLLIILPGVLALGFWGLNLGTDFTGGSSIELRTQSKNVTTAEIAAAFQAAGAKDVRIFAASNLGGGIPAQQYAYITFNRPIGIQGVADVMKLLEDPKAGLPKVTRDRVYYTVTYPNAKDSTSLLVVHFDKAVQATAITAALKTLPPTDAAPPTTSSQPSTSATPAATAGTTPGATPGTTPTVAPTATVGAATPTPTTAPAQTFPISVTNVLLGQNDITYRVDTQTSFDTGSGASRVPLDSVIFALDQKIGPTMVQSQAKVGPSIATETTRNAVLAVIAASIAILFYIAIAFRKVGSWQQSVRYGASAILALLHDVLVVLGIWAILGHFFDFKVDTLFLTAVLTVIGFSVHDTIVVFDRLRENMRRRTNETFEMVVDASLIQTMNRSLNTSLTVLFTLAALTLFGGTTIREFTLALLIGIASGTYSSIFNASMILVVWETGEYRRWFGRRPKPAVASQSTRSLARARR